MLDEQEFASIQEAHQAAAQEVKHARVRENRPLTKADEAAISSAVTARYSALTGISNADHREILRHRLSRLGPPCARCGKELRSPRAKECLECGFETSA
jgi:hypothetical protein